MEQLYILIEGKKEHYLGCKLSTPEQIKTFPPVIKTFEATLSLPSVVDLTSNFPEAGNQVAQSSCVAWAVAYAYKTFQEKLDHKWSANTKDHQFSPAYIYNQLNGGVDQGLYINEALQLIVDQGVCTLADMPYKQDDFKTQPNPNQREAAYPFRAISWGYLGEGNVNAIKGHLADGDAVVVAIPVYPDFDSLSSSNPIYDNVDGTSRGNHAICFVGYDDSKQAFKLINSWGTNWGFNGFGYMSYNLVRQLKVPGYVMQDIVPDLGETKIAIMMVSSGKFLTAVHGGGVGEPANKLPLHTDATKIGPWEKFKFIKLADEVGINYAIQTINGHYLTAVNGGGIGEPANELPLHTDATKVGPWEKFILTKIDENYYAIQTIDGHYLTAVNEGGIGEPANKLPFHTDATNIGPWEKFKLIVVNL